MATNNKWRGYDLEQLHIQQATTRLRIEIEKERLRCQASRTFGGGSGKGEPTQMEATVSAFYDVANVVTYGIKGYKIVKKIIDACREPKN